MDTLRIVGQPKVEDAWLHRFRNFGEDVYVRLRDRYAVSIEEIDSAIDTFHVRDIPAGQVTTVADALVSMLRTHHLDDSAVVVPSPPERSGFTVVLVVDPACGDHLWEIASQHDAWVVPSEVNRAVVEQMWTARKGESDGPSITIWSAPTPAVTEQDWLTILDAVEVHHASFSCEPPLDTLSVYGASVTAPITEALREYEYELVKPTGLGFIAFKRQA